MVYLGDVKRSLSTQKTDNKFISLQYQEINITPYRKGICDYILAVMQLLFLFYLVNKK